MRCFAKNGDIPLETRKFLLPELRSVTRATTTTTGQLLAAKLI